VELCVTFGTLCAIVLKIFNLNKTQILIMNKKSDTAILLIHCPDQRGIVATVSKLISDNNGNIIYLDQHTDYTEGVFFMRIEWELDGFAIPTDQIIRSFEPVAKHFDMTWNLYYSWEVPRMAIFVSKLSHCLDDILARYHAGEWVVTIPLIISNHEELKKIVEKFDIDFYHFPKDKDNKKAQETVELRKLEEYDIEFIVLARYMQILSGEFVSKYENRIINIHHSFLPAFPGAKPYHSAFDRGVKVIGATSHIVTEELDAGPIIEQDVTKITHRDTVGDMIRKGRDLEKIKSISKPLAGKFEIIILIV